MTYFARVYDELMDPTVYRLWLTFIEHLDLPENVEILDVGCGSGVLTDKLAELGYEMTGLDVSENMLSLAQQLQQTTGRVYPLIQRDMLDLEDLGPFDVVIATLDTLCHLESEEDVLSFFKEAYAVLNEQGALIFDVHSIYKMTQLFPMFQYHEELDGQFFAWTTHEGDVKGTVIHELDFFIEKEDGSYERFEEEIYERSYPIDRWYDMLDEAGFEKINVFGDDTRTTANHLDERWYFVATKGMK